MLFYLVVGTIAGIIVSLITRPVAHGKLERFYALLRTPVRRGEVVPAACTLPVDAVVPPRRNLLPFKSIELAVPSLTSVIGFLAGTIAAAGLIFALFLIIRH
jgi:hypothetical protein